LCRPTKKHWSRGSSGIFQNRFRPADGRCTDASLESNFSCREKRDPDQDEVAAVTGHSGTLDGALRYHVVQFPAFPTVDLSNLSLDPAVLDRAAKRFVLAPYFSAIVYSDGGIAHYFVLGQSPAAGTTLREVTPEMNANLGPGCEPEPEAFLSLLRDRLRAAPQGLRPVAGIMLKPPHQAPPAKRWWQFWK